MKKSKQYIISFFISFILFIITCYNANIIFGGTKSFLLSDLRAQYIAFFAYLQEVFMGSESLFYSFSKGLGGNMIGTFAYYLASPLNFIIVFFSKQSLDNAILLIISLKIGLAGLTMFSYLKGKYEYRKTLYIFSSCYALMGYIVVYFFNSMWLDAIYLAPLLLLGIDKIIAGKKSLLYGLVLFLVILTNYYIGYMLCLLSCLYFIYQMILKYNFKENKELIVESVVKFGITSLIAGCMAFVLFLPTIYELAVNVGRVGLINPGETVIKFNILEQFARFYMGAHNKENILNHSSAALYTGLIILPLVYFYFVNKEIKVKEKLFSAIILLILTSGLFIPQIDFVWHGFSDTHSFDFRYSFIISMFLIIIACKSFYKIKNVDLKHYLIFLIIYLILSTIIIVKEYIFLESWFVYLSVVVMILYLLLLKSYHKSSNKDKKLLTSLLMILVFAEMSLNFYLSIYKYEFESTDEYNISFNTINAQLKDIRPKEKEFYRIEKEIQYGFNDSMLLDYNGVTIFISTLNKKMQLILENMGYHISPSFVRYNVNGSPISDAILGLKYILSREGDLNYDLITSFPYSSYIGLLFDEFKDDVYVYENPNSLSLGFMVNDKVNSFIDIFKEGKITNEFEVQNYMLKTMLDSKDDYLKSYYIEKISNNEFEVTINNGSDIYIRVPSLIVDKEVKIFMYINDELIKVYNQNKVEIYRVKNKYENSKIKFRIETSINEEQVDFMALFYYLNEELFLDGIKELKKNQLQIIKQEKNYIKGKIDVDEYKKVLFTSIPYEKGWTILVDGKKVDYYPIFDSFIGLNLEVGEHEIEFKFVPPLFKLGLIISIIASLLFILYIRFEKNIVKFIVNRYLKYEEIINYLIAGGLTTIVSIGSYAILARLFGINYIISTILSFVLAVLFAYYVNKVFVFKTNFNDKKKVLVETYQFFKYRMISLGIDVILMIAFVEWLHINDLIAKIVVQIVVVIMNYFFSKLIVFKKVNN